MCDLNEYLLFVAYGKIPARSTRVLGQIRIANRAGGCRYRHFHFPFLSFRSITGSNKATHIFGNSTRIILTCLDEVSFLKWRWCRASRVHNSQTPNWTFLLPLTRRGIKPLFPRNSLNEILHEPAVDVSDKKSRRPSRFLNHGLLQFTIILITSTTLVQFLTRGPHSCFFFAADESILWSTRICVYAFLSLKGLSVYVLLVYIPRNFAVYLTRRARMHGISVNPWSNCCKIHTPKPLPHRSSKSPL
jgi:hypothetical protein